jgi:hypothetical protein
VSCEGGRPEVGPEVGPTSDFYRCLLTGNSLSRMHGPTCVLSASPTTFSLCPPRAADRACRMTWRRSRPSWPGRWARSPAGMLTRTQGGRRGPPSPLGLPIA